MREAFRPFAYEDLKQNTAYKVVAGGGNDDFGPGLVFWIDPRDGSLCIAGENGGWLDKDDISEDLFSGITVSEAEDYYIVTSFSCGGGSTLVMRERRRLAATLSGHNTSIHWSTIPFYVLNTVSQTIKKDEAIVAPSFNYSDLCFPKPCSQI